MLATVIEVNEQYAILHLENEEEVKILNDDNNFAVYQEYYDEEVIFEFDPEINDIRRPKFISETFEDFSLPGDL